MKRHFMKKNWLWFIVISAIFWGGIALGQTFPDKPTARLGKGTVRQVAYSPDGKLLAVAGGIGIWLYDANNLNEIGLLEGYANLMYCIAFSPDGKMLASGSIDGTIYLWDVTSKKQLAVLEGHNARVYSVAFSPDGKMIASGSTDNTTRLWSVDTKKQVDQLICKDNPMVISVAFSPNGKLLACGCWNNVLLSESTHIWDVESKQEITIIKGHGCWVVTFSPDGKLLATGSNTDGTILLWDLEGRREYAVLNGHGSNSIEAVSFSPDGKSLASGDWDGNILLWNVKDKNEVALGSCIGRMSSISFSPDSKTLATVEPGTVRFWNVAGRKQSAILEGYTGCVCSIAFNSMGGTFISAGYDNSIRLWDTDKQRQVGELVRNVRYVYSLSFSPDYKMLAFDHNDTVWLWDVEKQKRVWEMTGHTQCVYSIAFSPDGKLLASLDWKGVIRLWDTNSRKKITEIEGAYPWSSIAFSPDGKIIAFCSSNAICLWDVQEKKQLAAFVGHKDVGMCLAFSPDGKIIAYGSSDGSVRLWNISKRIEIATLEGHRDTVLSIAFSPDGKILASGGGFQDKTVRLWDVNTQKQLAVFQGHKDRVKCLAFSPNGKWLVSGSEDGTMLLWEVNLPSSFDVEPKDKNLTTWGSVKHTELYQNYPNPFNPETWIPYQLAEDSEATINIYDAEGKLVRTLKLGHVKEEKNQAYWDGKDEKGQTVASGVYFYVLKSANEFTDIKKMVLLK